MVGLVLGWALLIYSWILIIRAVGSWIFLLSNVGMPGWLVPVWTFILAVTDPPLRLIGRIIPPARLGGVSIDLAFLVLFILVGLAQRLVAMYVWF